MKLISLYITDEQENLVQKLVTKGSFQDRSAAIRNFIDIGIKIHFKLINEVIKN